MTSLEPVSVALKFGFLAVLYLFVLWVARSARRDLRSGEGPLGRSRGSQAGVPDRAAATDGTGLYPASELGSADIAHRSPQLVVERAPGHDPGMIYDLDGDLLLGRGDRAEIRLEDPFASSRHARIYEQGNILVIEDLGSTNGTYLNEEVLQTPRPLHPGDRVRIGDSEFVFEVDSN
jgi:pSer/pThr/pTyr-binding forkhead associated (FHA) protein